MGQQRVKLEKLCVNITDGKHGDCENQSDSGFYFLSCKDVSDGSLRYDDARQITETDFWDTHRRTRLEPQDILITNSGTIGRMALAPATELTARTTFQKSVAILKPRKERVLPHFLYYTLHADRERLIAFAGGTAQKNLLLRDLRAFSVDLPPFPIQKRIASILSAYDDLIENNTRRIKILEEMAQMLYREWFVNFRFPGHERVKMVESELGPIPNRWETTTLRQVTSFVGRGISPVYDDSSAGIVINQKCIRDRRLNLHPARRQRREVPEEKLVRVGDILINSTGIGTLGRVAQVHQAIPNCTVDSHVSIVRPRINADFLGQVALELQPHFESSGIGSTGQTELGRERIGDMQLVLPPEPLQHAFSEAVGPMNRLIVILLQKNTNLRSTRDLLLPKLISGEIPVEAAEEAMEQTA